MIGEFPLAVEGKAIYAKPWIRHEEILQIMYTVLIHMLKQHVQKSASVK